MSAAETTAELHESIVRKWDAVQKFYNKQSRCYISERNAAINAMRAEGKTYREIGEKFQISSERVRQIIPRVRLAKELLAAPSPPEPEDDLIMLGLSVRAYWSVLDQGITKICEMGKLSRKKLEVKRNCGRVTIAEIESAMRLLGMTLGD